MKNLKQGENIALAQAGITGNTIFSGISWNIKSNQQVDIDVYSGPRRTQYSRRKATVITTFFLSLLKRRPHSSKI